jgi:hypothetical protein
LTVRKWRQCKIVNLVPYLITFRNIKRYPLVAFLTSLFSSNLQLHELCPRNMEIVITFSASSSNATCAPYPKMKSFHFAELRIEPISRYSSYPCYAILLIRNAVTSALPAVKSFKKQTLISKLCANQRAQFSAFLDVVLWVSFPALI